MQSVKLAACAWSVAVAAVAASSATQAQAPVEEAPVEAPLGPQVSQAEAAAPADAASQDLPAPAAADTSEADEAAASEAAGDARTDGGIEEVVVTAQRRKEKLQDVPVTITAFTAEQLSEARIVAVQDVATRTPGLVFDAFPSSQPRLAVRGIGSSDRGAAGDPSSAVFLDEVYLGRPAAVAFDAFDVERVEVLKGPQGTLYGRNVVGGAVNVITRKPDFTKFDAGAQVTVGNYARAEDAG
ncbi:TonB-dependent receptor plug domain-containing protein, partial [Hydrocarboniphaga effusa]